MASQDWSLFCLLELQAKHVLTHIAGSVLQNGVIAKFQFQRLGSYWETVSQSL